MWILEELMPDLNEHFTTKQFDLERIIFEWFLSLFTCKWPEMITQTIWDFILLEGSSAIFKIAFAILDIVKYRLMEAKDIFEIDTILTKEISEHVNNEETLVMHIYKYSDLDISQIRKLREISTKEKIREGKITSQIENR